MYSDICYSKISVCYHNYAYGADVINNIIGNLARMRYNTFRKDVFSMAKYCPIIDDFVTYLVCQECDERICCSALHDSKKANNDNKKDLKENHKKD